MSEQDGKPTPVPASPAEPKRRSVSFPQLSLREAVEAILTIGQHGASHSQDAVAAYLGHSTANSGAFRSKLAALRDWGLIERGAKDRVTLSDIAHSLVLDDPERSTAAQLRLTAFESCKVFGALYNDSAKDTPLDMQRVRTSVVMRHGVASDQADKFVDIFIESAVYAGIARFDGLKVTLLPREAASRADDTADGSPEASEQVVITGTTGQAWRGVYEAVPVALRQAWAIDGGQIEFIIRTSQPLPPSIYTMVADMAEVAARMQEHLSKSLFEPTAENSKLPASYHTHLLTNDD